jgi:cytoskeleton protein RodZ
MNGSVSQQLRQAREARSISLETAAQSTRIRLHYLKAIEAGDFAVLPSPAQARGLIRSYASYLGLDPVSVLAGFSTTLPGSSSPSKPLPVVIPPPGVDTREADEVFQAIGHKLRSQRELLGLGLEDVERHTHIRMHYLKALEEGNLRGLPSPVQGRGMLNNYANYIGIDPEPILLRYAEGLQALLTAKQSSGPSRSKGLPRRFWSEKPLIKRVLSTDFYLGALAVAFLVGFFIWGGLRISEIRLESMATPSPQPAPSISEVLASNQMGSEAEPDADEMSESQPGELPPSTDEANEETNAAEEDPESASGFLPEDSFGFTSTPTDTPAAPQGGASPLQIFVVISQRTWLRVMVDGTLEFEGRVLPGSAYPFYGENRIEVRTGNGAAVQVFFNQTDLGPMGILGEVVDRVYTVEGILTPTPTVTPTWMLPPTSTPSPVEEDAGTPTPDPELEDQEAAIMPPGSEE